MHVDFEKHVGIGTNYFCEPCQRGFHYKEGLKKHFCSGKPNPQKADSRNMKKDMPRWFEEFLCGGDIQEFDESALAVAVGEGGDIYLPDPHAKQFLGALEKEELKWMRDAEYRKESYVNNLILPPNSEVPESNPNLRTWLKDRVEKDAFPLCHLYIGLNSRSPWPSAFHPLLPPLLTFRLREGLPIRR